NRTLLQRGRASGDRAPADLRQWRRKDRRQGKRSTAAGPIDKFCRGSPHRVERSEDADASESKERNPGQDRRPASEQELRTRCRLRQADGRSSCQPGHQKPGDQTTGGQEVVMKRSILSLILLPFLLLSCGALWQSDTKSPVELARTGMYKEAAAALEPMV